MGGGLRERDDGRGGGEKERAFDIIQITIVRGSFFFGCLGKNRKFNFLAFGIISRYLPLNFGFLACVQVTK